MPIGRTEGLRLSQLKPITLRVLEGSDRGRVFENLLPPISIGREEGNSIQLNDDRVSRFHLKINWDSENLVLADLESTNGTRVNGEDTQLRILRSGDLITIGRSTMVLGSRDQINKRLGRLNRPELDKQLAAAISGESSGALPWESDPDYALALLNLDPPKLPGRMSPGQAAQMAEILEYLHFQLRRILADAEIKQQGEVIEIAARHWQQLIDMQSRLAEYLRQIARPI